MSEEEVVEEPLPEAPVGDVSLGEVSDHEPSLEEILESLEIPESTDDASVVKTPVPQEALVVLPEPKSVEVPTPLPELKLSEFVRPATELHPDLTDSLFEAHILKLIYSDSNMLLMYYKKGYTLEQLAESESNTIEGVSRRLEKAQKRLLILVEVKEAGMRSFFVRKGASALDVHICMSLWKHGRFTKDAAEDLGSKGLRMSVGKMRKRFDSFFKTLASSMITDPMDASIIHMLKRISDDN